MKYSFLLPQNILIFLLLWTLLLLPVNVQNSSELYFTCASLSIPLVSEASYAEDSPFYDISPGLSPKLLTHLFS